LLAEAKAGTDEKKFHAVWDELRLFREYDDRESIKKVNDEAGKWTLAFREIREALEEYRNANDRTALEIRLKLAKQMRQFDSESELAITRMAGQELNQ